MGGEDQPTDNGTACVGLKFKQRHWPESVRASVLGTTSCSFSNTTCVSLSPTVVCVCLSLSKHFCPSAHLSVPGLLSSLKTALSVDLPPPPAPQWKLHGSGDLLPTPNLGTGIGQTLPAAPVLGEGRVPSSGPRLELPGIRAVQARTKNQPTALLPGILNMPLGLACFSSSLKKNKGRRNSRRPVVRAAPTGLGPSP